MDPTTRVPPEAGDTRVVLDGTALSLPDLIRLADAMAEPAVDPSALDRLHRAREQADRLAAGGRWYGRGTGVGAHRSVPVDPADETAHGLRILRSHAGGAGPLLPPRQIRAMLTVRANQLLSGGSGIHPAFVTALTEALRLRVHPAVNEYGGIGTGDLTALAQTGLTLLGERPWVTGGEAWGRGEAGRTQPGPAEARAAASSSAAAVSGGSGSGVAVPGEPGSGLASSAGPGSGVALSGGSGSGVAVPGGPGSGVALSGGSGSEVAVPGGPGSGVALCGGSGSGVAVSGGTGSGVAVPGEPGSGLASSAGPGSGVALSGGPGSGVALPAGPGSAVARPGEPGSVGVRPVESPPGLPAPVTLRSGDALALLSSNALALGQAGLAWHDVDVLLRAAHAVAALSLAAVSGSPEAYAAPVHALRPYPGPARAAAEVRRLLGMPDRPVTAGRRIQDPFGFRAFPQVHGAALEACEALRRIVEVEINCPTENPVLTPDGHLYHHGGFFAAPLGLALDGLNLALLQTAQLSVARLNALGRPDLTGLPAFLASGPAGSSGTMILEYTANSALAEVRSCAAPASAGHAVLSHGLEETASFAGQAARQTSRAADAYATLLACELVAAVRALRLQPVTPTVPAFAVAAAALPSGTEDRPLTGDITTATELLLQLAEL
ncbi:aromatic amino acid lyase [Streptomyces sp. NPDC048710]|uniref:aromatic amino acid lyase n=1 Tax=Streptomyces sp. NPDC048710 TaxID=3365586 RepID=UPI003714895D